MSSNYSTSDENRMFATDFLISLRNTTIVLFILLAIVFAVLFSKNYISIPGVSSDYSDAVEDAVWCHETFERWDALIAAGDYDKMVETVHDEYDSKHSCSSWKHFDFYSLYRDYLETLSYMEKYPGKLTGSIMYDFMRSISLESNTYFTLTAEEKAFLADKTASLTQIMYENFGIDPNTLDELYSSMAPDGYVVYKNCSDYADAYNAAHAGE